MSWATKCCEYFNMSLFAITNDYSYREWHTFFPPSSQNSKTRRYTSVNNESIKQMENESSMNECSDGI